TAAEGEEWIAHPFITLLHLRLWVAALRSIGQSGTTPIGRVRRTIDDRPLVTLFPSNLLDATLFPRVHAEVHLQAGASADERARFYRQPDHEGRVVLVLGGGNVNSIPPLDVATKMINEGKVCLLKMNPVNAYLGPLIEEAFAEAIRQKFLAVVYGGAEEGAYLANHPRIDEVLITGSDRTHDLLVWGPPGPEREARQAANRPLLNKPITSELGNISPVIVVPGPYSDRQLAWQAQNIGGGVTNNASFNCNANKMLITARGWDGGRRLLDALERVFERTPVRAAYYPGAQERYRRLTAGRRDLRTIGAARDGALPWTLLTDLDSADPNEEAFRMEPFCSILSETAVENAGTLEFLDRAVHFANERLWGTLSATIVIHPSTLREPGVAEALERAIVQLQYGTVGINIWGAYGFALGTPWGGHPTSTATDIQSGHGFVHNVAMLEGVEKTVVRHPLTVFPKPAHFPSHRTADRVGRRLVAREETGGALELLQVVAAAVRG
ncbi:MAG TPA: aldehyde dehydrogenase, partial [Candidatus Dormibacteraeota bacterium]|nr:aldehyde dehydrogenase [Candidatus Dormibacteraeota bacterium]